MRRGGRNPNQNPGVKPVERIELSEKMPIKRLIAAGILLAIGLGFFGYALSTGLSREKGWTEVEPMRQSAESVAVDFTLYYELGVSEKSTTAEYKAVSALYTEACAKAYRLFHAQYGFEDVHNPYYINRHPGEVITVDPVLYDALETVVQSNSRVLFAAPYYTQYANLFRDSEDSSAAQSDPYKSQEISDFYKALSVFTASGEHVSLDLLGQNQLRLNVSEAYLAYAKENGIENFIDFYWLRNAFVADYIAETLTGQGYPYGTITSFDGFMRVFDTRQMEWTYNLYGRVEGVQYDAARLGYTGGNSLVFLRAFRMNDRDETYYAYKTGEERHPYIDPIDGLCKNTTDTLVSYSYTKGCGEVLLSMLPAYIGETFDPAVVSRMQEQQVYSVWFDGTKLLYNDTEAKITPIPREDLTFTAQLVK